MKITKLLLRILVLQKPILGIPGDVHCWECEGETCDTVDQLRHTRKRCEIGSSACQMFITGILSNRTIIILSGNVICKFLHTN